VAKGRDATIRELVHRIVDAWERSGKSTENLAKLHDKLVSEMEAATDPVERTRIYHDLQFLEGYQETPATLLTDLKATRRRATS